MLTLIYTSGTTGPPKGVQLTHAQHDVDGALRRTIALARSATGSSPTCPMAHIAERGCQPLPADAAAAFTSPRAPIRAQVVAYLPDVRPTWFVAVPRVWEKLKAGARGRLCGRARRGADAGDRGALEVG